MDLRKSSAVVSATDKTGAVFDKLAQAFKGIEKAGLEAVKVPKFTGDLYKDSISMRACRSAVSGRSFQSSWNWLASCINNT
jgi:hypothetical protein